MKETLEDKERQELVKRLFIFFAGIYFIQGLCQGGISGLFYLPLSFMLKDQLGFDQAQLAYFRGLVLIPWAIKPLYGICSDFIPILGYRRKSWYIIVAFLGMGSALYLAKYCNYDQNQLLFTLSLTAVSFAFADVLCDAVMVENGKVLSLTDKFQGTQWAAMSLAAVLAGLGGGIIATYFSYSLMFLMMALPSLAVLIIAIFFVPEKRHQYRKLQKSEISFTGFPDVIFAVLGIAVISLILLLINAKSSLSMSALEFTLFTAPFFILGSLLFLLRKMINRMTFFCIGFLFWWNFSIGLNVAPFFYYQTHTLGFSEMFMGKLQTVGNIGSLLGALLFLTASRRKIFWKKRFIGATTLANLLKLAGGIGVIVIISNFLLMGAKSAIAINIITLFIYQFALLVMLVLAAEFCPKAIEGTFFALLMSVCNLGTSMSERASGALYNFFRTTAPSDFNDNYWAKLFIWLGWPIQHADPKTPFDIFIQYYAIGWLIVISLSAFLLYFVLIRRFGASIKEKKELKDLDLYSLISLIKEKFPSPLKN